MSSITESVDVDVPVPTAYNQWTQFESFPVFMEGVEQATITEQLPDERVAWHSDAGPSHAGVVTFHRIGEGRTRVTAQLEIDPDGFVENVADKLGVLTHRVKGDLSRFKTFIEERGHPTGTWRGSVDRPNP